MAQPNRPGSKRAGKPGDDFARIDGIGPKIAQRLRLAGIRTYEDLATRTPEEIATFLVDVGGVSPQRIANQDWTGQARRLAGPAPESSEPTQHYASFHIELLLDADNNVRRTKVRHHQSDTDDAWPGWEEARLLRFLREQIPLTSAEQPTDAATPQSSPSFFVRIEELAPVPGDESAYVRQPDQPVPVRLTLNVVPTDGPHDATVDFTAEVAARKLGLERSWPLGTSHGAARVNDPLSVDVMGPPLPLGLYRLVATVVLFPAHHNPKEPPLLRRSATGGIMRIVEAASTPAAPT
jgi:Helix-hairpin-helix domain